MSLGTLQRWIDYAGLARETYRLRASDDQQVRRQAAQHVAERLGRMRGLPQKLGQMLSFRQTHVEPDAGAWLPDEAFARLDDRAVPLPLSSLEGALWGAWGRAPQNVVAQLDPAGHAASLGQVHRARLHDGREVAVKIQYPGIRAAIRDDLRLLGWLSLPVGGRARDFDLEQYRAEILRDLDEELDYRREADHQRAAAVAARGHAGIVVPEVIGELSTDTVLVSTWVDGQRWGDVCPPARAADARGGASQRTSSTARQSDTDGPVLSTDERRTLAEGLLAYFLDSLLEHGIVQADWHPGNVRFRRTPTSPQMVLYDFGCVYRASLEQRLTLLGLIRATMRGDGSIDRLLLKLGFDRTLLEPLAHKLPALCRLLFEPFRTPGPFDLAQWRLAPRVADVLGDDRWNFRAAGPAELVFLLRAWHGMVYYLRGLDAPVDWSAAIAGHLSRWQLAVDGLMLPGPLVTDNARDALDARDEFDARDALDARDEYDARGTPGEIRRPGEHRQRREAARHLKIRITENRRTRVELTLPHHSIDDLDDLLDDDVKARIAARGIDLATHVDGVRRRGYAAGEVFALEENGRTIRVWLD